MFLRCLSFCIPEDDDGDDDNDNDGEDKLIDKIAYSLRREDSKKLFAATIDRAKHRNIELHAQFRAKEDVFAARIDEENEEVEWRSQGGGAEFYKTEDDISLIKESLNSSSAFLFDQLSPEQMRRLIDEMELCHIKKGSIIIRQEQVGEYFYIVREGTVAVFVADEEEMENGTEEETMQERRMIIPCHNFIDDNFSDDDFDENSGVEPLWRNGSRRQTPASYVLTYPSRNSHLANSRRSMHKCLSTIGDITPYGGHVANMHPGVAFGEILVLHRTKCAATFIADTDVAVWRILGDVFRTS